MSTNRLTTTALAALALGLAACAPTTTPLASPSPAASQPADPATPTPSPTAVDTTTSAVPTEPASSVPSETAEPPSATDLPSMAPADGDLPGAAACYDESGQNRTLDPGVEIEKGAVKAWLCGDAPGGYGSIGPMEPLLTDVDAILDDFAALPDKTDGQGPQEAAGVYRVVFEYADGSLKVLEGDAQAEGPVWAGEAEKVGGSDFLNQVRGRWLDQRLAVGGPDEEALIHSMACPAPDHYLVAHPLEDVLAGWICDASSAEVWQSALEPSLAQQIAGEIRDNSTPVDGNLPITDVSVSLMVPWGEATPLRMLTNEPGFLWVSEQGAMQYQPSADVEREIASLLNA